MTQQYNNLDPIALKEKIKYLQNQLWKHAWGAEVSSAIDEVQVAEAETTIEEINLRLYRKTKKAPLKRDYRTRKDPFDHVHEFIRFELEINPVVSITDILNKLIQEYPGDFCKSHLRTLQSRVSEIRTKLNNREEKYQAFMINRKTMTTKQIECIL